MKQDIDGYTKLSVLGRGAYSTIFLARERATGEISAIKQVYIANSDEMRYVGHVESEHAIAQKFDHPVLRKTKKIVYLRKWFKVSSVALIMEYADGKPLSDLMPSQEYARMLKIFRHIAEGLDNMHWHRYVHADLKPENMIVNTQDRVKIIDYGQTFEVGQAKERVQGTVDFMAPEQVNREILDQRTDVFGFGAVMHRVFTDKPLQTKMNKNINQHTLANIGKRVEQGNPLDEAELPPLLHKLIHSCCQERRENRPPNMKAVINLIDMALEKLQHQRLLNEQNSNDADLDETQDDFFNINFAG